MNCPQSDVECQFMEISDLSLEIRKGAVKWGNTIQGP